MKGDKVGKKTLKIMKNAVWYNNWLFNLIKPFLKGEILEVGAGIGNFTPYLKSRGGVAAIEIERDYIAKLKKIKGIKAGFGDVEKGKYFFKGEKFDSIVCLNVLEHISKDDIALRNMYKLLKDSGRLVLLVPAHQWAYGTLDVNLGHYRRYDKRFAIARLKKAGFKIKFISYLNWVGVFGWFINARILKKKVISKNQLGFFDKIAWFPLLVEKVINVPFGLSVLVVGEK